MRNSKLGRFLSGALLAGAFLAGGWLAGVWPGPVVASSIGQPSGATPAGAGTEHQYRASASTLGASNCSEISSRLNCANLSYSTNFVSNNTQTTSAAGTTTLTSGSNRYQQLTGSTTQTYKLPSATTLEIGTEYEFDNQSTGLMTIQDSAAGAVTTVPSLGYVKVRTSSVSTAAGAWLVHFLAPASFAAHTVLGNNTSSATVPAPVRLACADLSDAGTNCTTTGSGTVGSSKVRAHKAASQSINNGSSTALIFDTNDYATGSAIHDTSTNNTRFTAPATGNYYMLCQVKWATIAGTGTTRSIAIRLNGSTISWSTIVGSDDATDEVWLQVSSFSPMTAGDYYECIALQRSGSSLNALGGVDATQGMMWALQ